MSVQSSEFDDKSFPLAQEDDRLISVQELHVWRSQAQQAAIVAKVSSQEVDWLIQAITGLDSLTLRLDLRAKSKQICSNINLTKLNNLWQKRLQERLPVQYLVGRVPWRHFQLKVSTDVLIPRPETELLIDLVREAVKQKRNNNLSRGNWVDLGTGSGAIALGLAEILPKATFHAVDCSDAALVIARENADNLNLAERINFYQGDWWHPLEHLEGKISGMVSNPPYIPTDELPSLQPEVFKHEPHLALDGGQDGLEAIRYLVKTSAGYLCPGGIWLIEMMAGQADAVRDMLEEYGCYDDIQVFKDLAGIERFALAYRC